MAQQENAPNKPVHLIFLDGVVIAFYELQWTIDGIWGYCGTPPAEFKITLTAAVVATVDGTVMYRSDRYYYLANEVAAELTTVPWPTAHAIPTAPFVVVVLALLSAVILGLFDVVWSHLTALVYG